MTKITNEEVVARIDEWVLRNKIYTRKTAAYHVAKDLDVSPQWLMQRYSRTSSFSEKFIKVDLVHLVSFAKEREHLSWEDILHEYNETYRSNKSSVNLVNIIPKIKNQTGYVKRKAKRLPTQQEHKNGFRKFIKTVTPSQLINHRKAYIAYSAFCKEKSLAKYSFKTFTRHLSCCGVFSYNRRKRQELRRAAIKRNYLGPDAMTRSDLFCLVNSELPEDMRFNSTKDFRQYLYYLNRAGVFSGRFLNPRSEFNLFIRKKAS